MRPLNVTPMLRFGLSCAVLLVGCSSSETRPSPTQTGGSQGVIPGVTSGATPEGSTGASAGTNTGATGGVATGQTGTGGIGAIGGVTTGQGGTATTAGAGPVTGGGVGGIGTDAGVTVTGGEPPLPEDWFDPEWTQRWKLEISDSELTEELSEFQVPVHLDTENFDYASAQPMGEDLRFVTPDGVILNHEIETWNAAGESLIWLLLPKLSSAPLELWVYSGNSGSPAIPEEDRRAVWPEPYSAVWHLGGDITDSSPDAYGAEEKGATFTEGKLGQGMSLSRSDEQYVIISPDAPIPILSDAAGSTFSAWIRPANIDGAPGDSSDQTDNGSIVLTVGGSSTGNHNSYTGYNVNYEGRMISHVDPADRGGYKRVRSDPGVVPRDEWTWVTYVVDLPAGEVRFYKNGAPVGAVSEGAFNDSKYASGASRRVVIGTEEDLTKHFWDGLLDELRIEKTLRSESWIAAQYRAMTTPGYVTISSE